MYSNGLLATKTNMATTRLLIPRGSVSQLILFPKPEDCKVVQASSKSKAKVSEPADLLLLCLHPGKVKFQNKPLEQICIQLPWDKTSGATPPTTSMLEFDSTCDATEAWKGLLCQALGGDVHVTRIFRNTDQRTNEFKSFQPHDTSSTTAGMPFVKCYHGVQDGVLYPIKEGLLFFK